MRADRGDLGGPRPCSISGSVEDARQTENFALIQLDSQKLKGIALGMRLGRDPAGGRVARQSDLCLLGVGIVISIGFPGSYDAA